MIPLNEFGRELMQDVRDISILHLKKKISGEMKDSDSVELANWLAGQNNEVSERMLELSQIAVDLTLHYLLSWIDEDEKMKVIFSGVNIVEESDGLAGELYGDNGWISRFSGSEPFLDD